MSAFSFTAPQFTSEDQASELDALSTEEKERIHDDLYGLGPSVEETDALLEEKLREFQTALEAIPVEEKAVYLEAIEHCPLLVETESEPIRFLRCEQFDAVKAAHRLVNYWDMRKTVFEEKAFLPMTLSGAFSEDHELLYSVPGFMEVLTSDEHGRAILFSDKTHVDFHRHDRMALTRMIWYVIHAALENETTQKKGFVAVTLFKVSRPGQFDRRQTMYFVRSVMECLPTRMNYYHYCHPPAFFQYIFPALAYLLGKEIRVRCTIHMGSNEAVLQRLEPFGIKPAMLPKCMGGSLKRDVDLWLSERRRIEHARAELQSRHVDDDALA